MYAKLSIIKKQIKSTQQYDQLYAISLDSQQNQRFSAADLNIYKYSPIGSTKTHRNDNTEEIIMNLTQIIWEFRIPFEIIEFFIIWHQSKSYFVARPISENGGKWKILKYFEFSQYLIDKFSRPSIQWKFLHLGRNCFLMLKYGELTFFVFSTLYFLRLRLSLVNFKSNIGV